MVLWSYKFLQWKGFCNFPLLLIANAWARVINLRRDPVFSNGNCDNFLSKIWTIDTPYQAGFDPPSARAVLQLNARTRAFTLQATTAGLNLKFMLQKNFFLFWTICPFAILESCLPVLTLCLLYHAHLGLYISCIHIFSSFFTP